MMINTRFTDTPALAIAVSCLMLLAAMCQPAAAQMVPVMKYYPDDPSKTLVLNIEFTSGGMATHNSTVVALHPSAGYADNPEDVRVQVFDVHDAEVVNFTMPDRLVVRTYRANGQHGQVRLPSTNSDVKVPFLSDADHVVISDVPGNSEMVTVGVKDTIHDFCVNHLPDPDCYEADLEVLSMETVDQPPLVLLGQSADLVIRTSLVNNGPESPASGVDAIFNQTATAQSTGISVSPTGITDREESDILIDEVRDIDQTYTVTCLEPGVHDIAVNSTVEPLSGAVIDTDASNNSADHVVSVDCAIPVTINNKPHSFPNSVNLYGSDSVAVAVLTTSAGEYGNPVAVGALTIDAATVTFGEPLLAANGQGAVETHGKNHFVRSYEPDDSTRDKDKDDVLHFDVMDTGLTIGDTEACIRGKLLYNGSPVTFYGCDSINVVN